MTRTINRKIFDLKELEKVEAEETVSIDISRSEIPLIHSFSNINEPSISFINWLSIFPISLFSLRLFADLGIPDIVETLLDTQSNF